ncbi:MAG: hypothetical protein H7296_09095 [Bacteroidia bacterium]|nr:hypothetical protein [Bacteroidia bacterium]
MKQIFFILMQYLPLYVYCQCNFNDQMGSPPEELNRRHLNDIHDNKVPGFRYGHPYTMFVKGDDFNLLSSLQKIRDNIRQGQPFNVNTNTNDYANLYKEIWEATNGDNIYEPNACNDADACPHPAWVKNNAIIYLIGLKVVQVGTS